MSAPRRRSRTRNQRTRIQLDKLLQRLLQEQIRVPRDEHLLLKQYTEITHITQYDFEPLYTGGDTVLSHTAIMGHQPKDGQENRVLYGSLIALISPMRSQTFQLKVDTAGEQKALEDLEDED
ncbi:uncharacterized protein BO66DRAFT_443807 [Aspergillus aculeatinus CBS 121060]|uniref:Uncharacterized protein n=1 Tax=Aspergillus aculeatinus CBS 121060 TaxID=1448322 RepID=A0ACD1GT60_9EURO|nr:hypothetical protein BO66DRAFT_443807 [Aspergillus aculeatinus CBS 121060]RAH64632.1 hypothetical protein BO66DRAFT_443807 [Aspergillus aculeatinus CBS 121060]